MAGIRWDQSHWFYCKLLSLSPSHIHPLATISANCSATLSVLC